MSDCEQQTERVEFELPYPPSVNNYWRAFVKPGEKIPRFYVDTPGKEYQQAVRFALMEQFGAYTRTTARIRLAILICPPTARKRDVDNISKATLDAMSAAGVWFDDEQVDDLRLIRGPVADGGKLRCRMELAAVKSQAVLEFEEF